MRCPQLEEKKKKQFSNKANLRKNYNSKVITKCVHNMKYTIC